MKKPRNNFAYIDAANLHNATEGLGWKLDYKKFRILLSEKYGVANAYIFIGLIDKYTDLYVYLQECGFILVFKEIVYNSNRKPKGNCDADLVLQITRDSYENKFSQAVIVSSDGDYAGLVKFLLEINKLSVIISPSLKEKCSILLKRTNASIVYLNDKRKNIERGK